MDLTLPELGDGIEGGDVLEIFVSVGDVIGKGDGIAELETDKATVTMPADAGGKVTAIHVKEGDTVNVGAPVISIEADAAAPAATPAPAPAPPKAVEPTPAPPAPAPVAPAPVAPTPAPVQETPAAPAPVAPVPSAPTPAAPAPPTAAHGSADSIPAGPAIRKFAREVGVDLASVTGTGIDGRIQREDVLAVVRSGQTNAPAGKAGGAALPAGTETDGYGAVRYEKLSKIRRTIANKMHESWTTCPRVTNFDDADVTDLEEFRQNSKADYAAQGIKLTSMPFVIKAVAMALKQNPTINASIDMEAGHVIYKDYVNLGIAIDSERGLIVPSMRNVETLSIPEIARELDAMVQRVRDGSFGIDELRGGSFSISNLGAIGGTYSTPIINYPETAILLIGRSRKLPVVVGDEIVPRLMMPLSLSYDHRLIDGGAAARFMNAVIGFLSAPSRILLAP